jgi:methionine sulfoxide reductase heme-binding subunit
MMIALRKKIPFSGIQLFVYLLAVIPGLWLIWDGLNDNLTINPIQALTQRTGKYALFFLLLSLACTPINTVFGVRGVLKVRRPLGLTAFLYAFVHFFLFIGVDYAFNPRLLQEALLEKPYALVGLAAFSILSILAATSFRWWMRKLGKLWKTIHRFVYLAAIFVIIHFFWVVKGDFLRLSGDIGLPLISTLVLALLLTLRLPPIRKWFSKKSWKHHQNNRGRKSEPEAKPAVTIE